MCSYIYNIYTYIHISRRTRPSWSARASTVRTWPLHDIVITNIVWCMAYKGRVGGRSYSAQKSRNSIAVVWVMLMGGGN